MQTARAIVRLACKPMPSIELVLRNKLGLHARAAAKLTQLCAQFSSDITLTREQHSVNAKSIMGVMMLAAGLGVTVRADAQGADAQEALDAMRILFEERFGEPE